MRELYMRKGHGFIIVYSVTDQQSFRQVRRFYTQILRARDRDSYPMILAANKIDLVQQRVVTPEEGQTLAQELGVRSSSLSSPNGTKIIPGEVFLKRKLGWITVDWKCYRSSLSSLEYPSRHFHRRALHQAVYLTVIQSLILGYLGKFDVVLSHLLCYGTP